MTAIAASTTPGSDKTPELHVQVKKKYVKTTIRTNASQEKLDMLRIRPCPHCDHMSVTKLELDTHKFSEHIDIYPIACEVEGCIYRAKQQWVMKRHYISSHSTDKNFKCSDCEYRAKTEIEIQRHIKSKHLQLTWECEQCDFKCDATKSVAKNMHMAKEHGDFSKVYKCDSCEFIASNRTHLTQHINQKHSKVIKFECDYPGCCYSALLESVVKMHQRMSHQGYKSMRNPPNDIGQYRKKALSQSLKYKTTRKRIHVVHKYFCSECREPYRFIQVMQTHITNMHDGKAEAIPTNAKEPGIMSHTCNKCGEQFTEYFDAQVHNRDAHADSAEFSSAYIKDPNYRPTYIKCTFCDFTCENWAGMKSHVRNNHENNIYTCDICGWITNSKNGFTNHKKMSHGAKAVKKTPQEQKDINERIKAQDQIIDSVAAAATASAAADNDVDESSSQSTAAEEPVSVDEPSTSTSSGVKSATQAEDPVVYDNAVPAVDEQVIDNSSSPAE
mgnify:FL=1